ncbi:MAG: HDOD domain protein [Candidatus Accumulibacter appositus]|uniref:HDOD domain protein n=1 Tax=Candidatus Accumulibacter appositus TaxID=1454003 RepID=A0A011QES0_9PROT|nr:HDOD domain-containing protein [Accumulibacter sp.]EXI77274.1 MAG: HDOD domain protein [Candidatus Accumulibacter appositus]HRF06441.1 HDOD domain-containing protein [Accumulibacter sp.]
MPEPYSFLRPLLAADKHWAALEWYVADPSQIEAGELATRFVEAGTAALAKSVPLVLATDPGWLLESEFIDKFEPDQAIFVLPAMVLDDAPTLALCQELRKQRRHLGLRLERREVVERLPAASFDHLQIDAALARYELSALDLTTLQRGRWRKIAVGVDSLDTFEWLAEKHFEFADSRFVTHLDLTAGGQPDLARLKVLKLLSLVIKDADTSEIEEVFRQEARLSYNLLRLVNSVAVGAKTRISSFHQAIALLGRRQLQRWLQLLIYADQLTHANKPNPLLQLAATRGRQMELSFAGLPASSAATELADCGDAAFMTGIFSLLDVLLKMPMSEILSELPLPAVVGEALSSQKGTLGTLLAAIVAGESGEAAELAKAQALLSGLGISPACHAMAQVGAFHWASRINSER